MGNCCAKNKIAAQELNDTIHIQKPLTRQTPSKSVNNHQTLNQNKSNLYDINEWKRLIESLKKNKNLEQFALAPKRGQFKNVPDLIKYLSSYSCKSQIEKAWLIYLWITHNIDYNIEGFRTGKYGANDSASVLATGLSVCDGYGSLFQELSKGLNLESIKIIGHGKGFGYRVGDKITEPMNHAWNAVNIDSKWYYIESTWGAGTCSNDYKYKKKFNPYWFMTPPFIFMHNHYSELHQFQPKMITLKEYEQLGFVEMDYHLYGFKLLSHNSTLITTTKTPLFIEFSTPEDLLVDASLIDESLNKQIENTIVIQRDATTFNHGLIVSIPDKNKQYKLNLYGKTSKDKRDEYQFATYFLVSRTKDDLNENIPKYSLEFEYNLKCLSHFSKIISSPHNPIFIEFSAPKEIFLLANLREKKENEFSLVKENTVIIQSDAKSLKYGIIVIIPDRNKTYQMNLFAKGDKNQPWDYITFFSLNRTKDDFNANIPKYNLEFDFNINCLSHHSSLIRYKTNPIDLIFAAPRTTTLRADIRDTNDKVISSKVLVQRNQDNFEIKVLLPVKDQFVDLFLFGKDHNKSESFEMVTKLKLIREQDDKSMDQMNFLKTYDNDGIESYIYSPIDSNLNRNEMYLFKFYFKNMLKVALVEQKTNKWIYFENNSDSIWTLNKSFDSPGEINVFVSQNNNNNFISVCTYCVK